MGQKNIQGENLCHGEFFYDAAKAGKIRPDEAVKLLRALRIEGEGIWLQTFADGPDHCYELEPTVAKSGRPYVRKRWSLYGVPKDDGKSRTVRGVAERGIPVTFEELATSHYSHANLARVGLFFCVNVLEVGAKRRKAEFVQRVAAVFVDLDGVPLPTNYPIEPTAVVESSPGKYHCYWAVSDLPLHEFRPVQQTLSGLYGGDPVVIDLSRVMRLPGFYHGKNKPGTLVRLISLRPSNQYTRADLLSAWPELVKALASSEIEYKRQIEDADRRQAEATQLRQQIVSGIAGTKAEVMRKYGQVALLGCCADLLAAPEKMRNNTLNAVAHRLGRIISASVLEESEVVRELTSIALRIGLESLETASTIHSGLTSGKAKPIDVTKIGQFVGINRKASATRAGLAKVAESLAGVNQGNGTLNAEEIPDPAGENQTYSDQQLKALLGIEWPVMGLDTDMAHACRLHDLAGDALGYVTELGGYVAWDGRQWLSGGKDGAGQLEAKRFVQRLGVGMQTEINRLLGLYGLLSTAALEAATKHGVGSPEAQTAHTKANAMQSAYFRHCRIAKRIESDNKQKAILSSAQTMCVKDVHDFDPRPWVVGFQNGTWDKGIFRPAQRDDHLLTLAAVPYDKDADRTDWLAVLDRMTGGDTDLQRTLRDVAGYALSGTASLRLLLWLYGPGGTGKSTYAELLSTVLGDMAATIDPKLFASDASRERLGAAIWNKRLAICSEAGNQRLDAEALKTLSGGDRLAVRMLYAESFTARASHALMMVANDAPQVEAYDDALKDRVLALPFDHPLDAGGPLLDGKRLEELRQDPGSTLVLGFTSWAVEGLAEVCRTGEIHRAAVCQAATRNFWRSVDPLSDFWSSLDVEELRKGIGVTDLRLAYDSWCVRGGSRPLGAQKFNRACKSVGLDVYSNGKVKCWRLFRPAAFPMGADQGEDDLTVLTTLVPISQSCQSVGSQERNGNEFMGNNSELGKVVSSGLMDWIGEEI